MPTLEDGDGSVIDVTPPGADEINARFRGAMTSDGPDESAPPKRRTKASAEDLPRRGPGRPRTKETQARTTTTTTAVIPLSDEKRANGVLGLLQIPATLALMAGKTTGNIAFEADAMTVVQFAPALAGACVEIAKSDPAFGARLDKIVGVGPYGALVSAGVGMVMQFARNHRPLASIPGTVHPDQLLNPPEETDDDEALDVAA